MAANKRKILEAARKLVQKGAKDKALAEYQRLLKLDPKDAKLRLEIGDAYRRWGQVDQAVETYTRVAEQYMEEGFDARAVAVFKQILNLAPDRLEAYAPLAELYERMGLAAEAIGALQIAADGYHRQGRNAEALGLLRRMANADPSNTRSRIKVADLLRREGAVEDAVAEYLLAAAELERQGEAEAATGVYRRIVELDDKNLHAIETLAKSLAERGKVAEAIPLAERALQLDDGNADRYEQLAALFDRAKRGADSERVMRRLADLLRGRGEEEHARAIVQSFGGADVLSGDAERPGDLAGSGVADDSDGLFGDEFPDSEGAPELSIDFGSDIDIGPGSSRPALIQPLGDSLGPTAGSQSARAAPGAAPAGSGATNLAEMTQAVPVATELDLEQLLAEASVYLRYGKRDKAIAHLQRVIDADPEHRGALEKLGEAYAENGENDLAVEVWMRGAKRARDDGDGDALRVLRGRIAALDEAAAASLASEAGAPSPADGAAGRSAPDLVVGASLDAGDDSGELMLDDDDRDDELFDELSLPVVEPPAEPATDDGDDDGDSASISMEQVARQSSSSTYGELSASAKQQVLDDLEEADFYMQQGLHDEAERIYQRVLSVAPNHPRALLRLGEIAAARGDASGSVSVADAGETPVPEVDLDEVDAAADDGDDESADEQSEPEEFEISVDLSEDALPAPDRLEASGDGDDLSDLDLDDADADESGGDGAGDTLEIRAGAEAPGGAATVPLDDERAADGDGGFDLAAALADAFDDDPAGSSGSAARSGDDGFAAVFQAFKKGVRETLSEGDHQAHYDLAIAYKEMGLLGDAIHELRTAMADPGRTAECLHLIGLCAIDADQAPLAIEHLEQLLTMSGLDSDASLAAHFDLGRALEAVGDVAGARREWEAVAAVKPSFQDVSGRLAGLAQPKVASDDDGFESFTDVIEEIAEEESADVVIGGETFDDLVAEANAEDAEIEPEAVIEAEPLPDEPEPEPPRSAPRAPRRKKKVSFL